MSARGNGQSTAPPVAVDFSSFQRWSGETLSVADADQLSRKELKRLPTQPVGDVDPATRFPINTIFNRKIILW
jgi:hypothetical protein